MERAHKYNKFKVALIVMITLNEMQLKKYMFVENLNITDDPTRIITVKMANLLPMEKFYNHSKKVAEI